MERLSAILHHMAASSPPLRHAAHVPEPASCAAVHERRRSVAELFALTGRVAIVTGGASGIGQQMSEALAEAGANVVVCARNADRCREYAAELSRHAGVRCVGLGCDVTSLDDIQRVVDETVKEFGRIDILVNNAGTAIAGEAVSVTEEEWDALLAINLKAAFFFTQRVALVMREQNRPGRIINISSVLGSVAQTPKLAPIASYSASKSGLIGLTKALAVEWAKQGITVNSISPAFFASDLTAGAIKYKGAELSDAHPVGRIGSVDDLKGATVFLASDASGFITGVDLPVDGGYLSV